MSASDDSHGDRLDNSQVGMDVQTWSPEPSNESPLGLAESLFEAIFSLFVDIAKRVSRTKYPRLHGELERLFLWGDAFSASDGKLDAILSKSADLRQTALSTLYELGRLVKDDLCYAVDTPAPLAGPDGSAESALAKPAQHDINQEVQQLLEQTAAVLDMPEASTSSDILSDDGSTPRGPDEILDDVAIYIDCLMDLSLVLESPITDVEPDDDVQQDFETFDVSSPNALGFCRRIRDRFPKMPKFLIERFGEANAVRALRLKSLREAAAKRERAVLYKQKEFSYQVRRHTSFDSRPKTTASGTNPTRPLDSIFDKPQIDSRSLSKTKLPEETQSFTPFMSLSTSFSIIGKEHPRAPSLAEETTQGMPITCLACGQTLEGVAARAWKKHIFDDLQPYLCTIQRCAQTKTLFKSSRAWATHESAHGESSPSGYTCSFCVTEKSQNLSDAASYYKHVAGHMRELSLMVLPQNVDEDASDSDSGAEGDLDHRWVAPLRRNCEFVEFGSVLEQLLEKASPGSTHGGQPVALVGQGGAGKKQVALEALHRISLTAPETWVFWVNASSQARIEEGFKAIADAVKLDGRNQPKANIPLLVHSWLSNEQNGGWVMVLHDADYIDIFYNTRKSASNAQPLATYLPQSSSGSIIITTRNVDLAHKLTGTRENIIEVDRMAEMEAVTLLQKKMGSPFDVNAAVDLVQALSYAPLAISQAAAYMLAREPRSSVKKYLELIHESQRKSIESLRPFPGDDHFVAIRTTYRMSFDHIRTSRPSAAGLLSLMSFFDQQSIPSWVLKHYKAAKPTKRVSGSSKTGFFIPNSSRGVTESNMDIGSLDTFEDDIAVLGNYNLITTSGADNFDMHGLVSMLTRHFLAEYGEEEMFKQLFINQMAASFPTPQRGNWKTCEVLLAHVERALDHAPAKESIERWAALLCRAGQYARLQGRYGIAERMVRKACKTCMEKLGRGHPTTIASTSDLADVLKVQGQWQEAETLELRVIKMYKKTLGENHPCTLRSMTSLAMTYIFQGRWKEAESLQIRTVNASKVIIGTDHPDTLRGLSNLASTYINQGRLNEAEKIYSQLTETSKNNFGAEHPETLLYMNNLASTFIYLGRWKEAERLHTRALELRKKVLGVDHPDTFASMTNLATAFLCQGRSEEAEILQMIVLETRKTRLGADHPSTLTSMFRLAITRESQGRYADAIALLEACAQTQHRTLGAKHPDTLRSLDCLGEWKEWKRL